MKNVFVGFNDAADVFYQFNVNDVKEQKDVEFLYAEYNRECYEGYALVLFVRKGKLYEVNGSHCSCFGLEGQWSPEETSLEALEKRNYSCCDLKAAKEAVERWQQR